MVLRILVIDDNPDDRLLAIRELNRAFADVAIEQVANAQDFEQVLTAGNFDLVITDYQLRWSDGISVLRHLKARYPAIPVVMFTNSGTEEVAVEAMKAGLDDYVLKSSRHYFRLPLAVRSSLEQAQQRQALKQAQTRYSELFARVPIGLYRITPEGQILEANPALIQLLGYADRQALLEVKTINIHMEEEVIQQWRQQIERDDVVRDFETQMHTLDGKTIWVRHNAKVIKDTLGKVLYYEGAIEDVTDRKLVEQERKALLAREQKARAEAEAASRMKDEFLATLSHELRTPLNAILGWANLLRQRQLSKAAIAQALETIERNARAQTQMIEELLDVSRIIRGQLRLVVRPVNLVAVLHEAIDAVQPGVITKNISLEFLLNPSLGTEVRNQESHPSAPSPPSPLMVSGDASRLQQVFWNLFSNAIKFTPPGGRVEIQLSVVGGNVVDSREHVEEFSLPTIYHQPPTKYALIQVKDTGQGISAEFLPYVFDYFRQADSTSTRSHGGLGLGLAIARQLVELHGGSISAASPGVGQGATFRVMLPLLDTTGEEKEDREDKGDKGENSPLEGVRVLLVDDETDSLDLLVFALEQQGANVVAASSAAEAKKAIATFEPDVAISDIAMPQEDGYELIRQMRAQGKDLPAIALTAYARDSDCNEAIAAGFQRHMSKPVDLDELVSAISELIRPNQ